MKKIWVPRVQKELLRSRLHSDSTESINNVKHVWRDVAQTSAGSDGTHSGPGVRETSMDKDTTVVRWSPPKSFEYPERIDRPPSRAHSYFSPRKSMFPIVIMKPTNFYISLSSSTRYLHIIILSGIEHYMRGGGHTTLYFGTP